MRAACLAWCGGGEGNGGNGGRVRRKYLQVVSATPLALTTTWVTMMTEGRFSTSGRWETEIAPCKQDQDEVQDKGESKWRRGIGMCEYARQQTSKIAKIKRNSLSRKPVQLHVRENEGSPINKLEHLLSRKGLGVHPTAWRIKVLARPQN